MKKVFLLIISFLICYLSYSQYEQVEVVKSSEKVIIEGTVYFIHEVKRGETLYSISQAYHVPLKELTRENPDILYGLRVGQILKIPFVEETKQEEKSPDKFIYHKVEKGETVYSLTGKYGIDTTALFKFNPEVRYGLKYGIELKIPRQTIDKLETEDEQEDKYIYHKVRRKETLYSLSKKYEVAIQDIKNENPELTYRPLKTGETIKIPRKTQPVIFDDRAFSTFFDSLKYQPDSLIYYIAEEEDCEEVNIKTINVALILPFYLEKNDLLNLPNPNEQTNSDEPKPFQIYRKTLPSLEFYEGLLIAIDSLKKEGLSINLYTYSVEDDTTALGTIINELILTHVDFVIGPVHTNPIKKITEFSNEYEMPVILPFYSNNDILLNHPNVFIAEQTYNTQNEKIAELISAYTDYNIVIINYDSFVDSIKNVSFKNALYHQISKKGNLEDVIIKEVVYNDTLYKSLEHSLSTTKKNLVFINNHTNEGFISEIVSKLNGLTVLKYDITIIGYLEWEWYRNIDVDYFYNLQLKFITPYYVDYENYEMKKFLLKYREIYHTEPLEYSYSFQGYDIMFYFGKALKTYGKLFPYCLSALDADLIHTDFKYYRLNSTSGFENRGGYIYQYLPDYKILKYPLDKAKDYKEIYP